MGYSRLMSEHEEKTLQVLKRCLSIFQQTIPKFNGRIFGEAGDSVIAEFPSALEAVRTAIEIQNEISRSDTEISRGEHMQFRMGISVGDVIIEGDDLIHLNEFP